MSARRKTPAGACRRDEDPGRRETQTWQQVNDLLANGRRSRQFTTRPPNTLEKLQQLAEFQSRRDDFRAKLRQLAERYRSRPSLLETVEQAGLDLGRQ